MGYASVKATIHACMHAQPGTMPRLTVDQLLLLTKTTCLYRYGRKARFARNTGMVAKRGFGVFWWWSQTELPNVLRDRWNNWRPFRSLTKHLKTLLTTVKTMQSVAKPELTAWWGWRQGVVSDRGLALFFQRGRRRQRLLVADRKNEVGRLGRNGGWF